MLISVSESCCRWHAKRWPTRLWARPRRTSTRSDGYRCERVAHCAVIWRRSTPCIGRLILGTDVNIIIVHFNVIVLLVTFWLLLLVFVYSANTLQKFCFYTSS